MGLTHLMLDIETLATDPNAVVLSIACVPFVLEDHTYFEELLVKGFLIKFNAQEQIQSYKRNVDDNTIKWWKTQPKEVFDAMVRPSNHDVSLKEGLTQLNRFIASLPDYQFKKSYVWCRRQ